MLHSFASLASEPSPGSSTFTGTLGPLADGFSGLGPPGISCAQPGGLQAEVSIQITKVRPTESFLGKNSNQINP